MAKKNNFITVCCDDDAFSRVKDLASCMDWTLSHAALYLILLGFKWLETPDQEVPGDE